MKKTINDQINGLKDKIKLFEAVAKECPESYYSESTNKFVCTKLNIKEINNFDLIINNAFPLKTSIICNPYIVIANQNVYTTAHGWEIGYHYNSFSGNKSSLIINAKQIKKLEKYPVVFFKVVKKLATIKHKCNSKHIKFTHKGKKDKKISVEKLDYYKSLINKYEILL